jgi:glycolate oxidase FAD binding subunit
MRDPVAVGDTGMTRADASGAIFQSGGGPRCHSPTSETELVDVLRNTPPPTTFRIVGRGSWTSVANRMHADVTLDLSGLQGITEYVPGDLTLTARAGTTLSEIAAVTAQHGQWLPLDPWGSPHGTLGATLATASAGPLAATIGLPRDAALGVTIIDAAGTRFSGGGRVVKNVAGFDLVRLQVGAWGTLGILTEATVRLRPLPATDRTVAIPLPADVAGLTALLCSVRNLSSAPLATEALNASLAAAIDLPSRETLLVRLGGSPAAVRAALDELSRHATATEVLTTTWDHVRTAEPPGATTVRYSVRPSDVASLWATIREATEGAALIHCTPTRGIVRVITTGAVPLRIRQAVAPCGVAVIAEHGGSWPATPPALVRLGQAIRDAFDPHRRLNPGLMSHVGD